MSEALSAKFDSSSSDAKKVEEILSDLMALPDRIKSGGVHALQYIDDSNRDLLDKALAVFDEKQLLEQNSDLGLSLIQAASKLCVGMDAGVQSLQKARRSQIRNFRTYLDLFVEKLASFARDNDLKKHSSDTVHLLARQEGYLDFWMVSSALAENPSLVYFPDVAVELSRKSSRCAIMKGLAKNKFLPDMPEEVQQNLLASNDLAVLMAFVENENFQKLSQDVHVALRTHTNYSVRCAYEDKIKSLKAPLGGCVVS